MNGKFKRTFVALSVKTQLKFFVVVICCFLLKTTQGKAHSVKM